jgi:hypothetical protein
MDIPDVPRAYDLIAEQFFADRPAIDEPESRGHILIVTRRGKSPVRA